MTYKPSTPIHDLGFKNRTLNCLIRERAYGSHKRNDLLTLADLAEWTDAELRTIPNLGNVSLKDIRRVTKPFTLEDPSDPSKIDVEMTTLVKKAMKAEAEFHHVMWDAAKSRAMVAMVDTRIDLAMARMIRK